MAEEGERFTIQDLPGLLDKDQLDSLRMEMQTLTPGEHETYKNLVCIANRVLLANYGDYISHSYSDEDLEQRFISTNEEGFKLATTHWYQYKAGAISYLPDNEGGAKVYPWSLGDFSITKDMWSQLDDQARSILIDAVGNEESAKIFMNVSMDKIIILEEITHLYQDVNKPLWFKEAGAQYYARESWEFKGFPMHDLDKRADFYEGLVNKYGDKMHAMFFANENKQIDRDFENQVLSEFTPEVIKDLFPDLNTK